GVAAATGPGMEPNKADVGNRHVKVKDRIAQAAPPARFLDQPRGHATAENIGEHLQAVERRIEDRKARQSKRDVHLLELALLDVRAAAETCRLRHWAGRPIEAGEMLLDVGDHGAMLDRTR